MALSSCSLAALRRRIIASCGSALPLYDYANAQLNLAKAVKAAVDQTLVLTWLTGR